MADGNPTTTEEEGAATCLMQIEAGASKSSRNPFLCVSGKQRNLSPRSAVEWKTRKRGSEGQQEGEGGRERERERKKAR